MYGSRDLPKRAQGPAAIKRLFPHLKQVSKSFPIRISNQHLISLYNITPESNVNVTRIKK